MLPCIMCPVMLRVIRSECIASLSLGRWRGSLGDYYTEAVEWMSPMGLDLGVNYGPFPRWEEYRVIRRREHTLILSMLEATQPLGSVPLAENSKMNVLESLGWCGRPKAVDTPRKGSPES